MCAVATADMLLCAPPKMADVVAGKCTSDAPSYLLSIFAPPSRCCVFLSQLLPMLHAQSVSISSVAVPVLVIMIRIAQALNINLLTSFESSIL
jgi:hypothetical protein